MTGVVPTLAATVVVLRAGARGPEVLLTRRPTSMAFGPGLHVFPGGRVDDGDADPRLHARLRAGPRPDPAGFHGPPFVVAAIREAWEETGILLAGGPDATRFPGPADARGSPFRELVLGHDIELRGDWLAPLSRWVTPPVVPRRYDTRFFTAWLPDDAVPAFDPAEVAGTDWLTPADALAAMADGRIDLWMPTSTTLQQLARVGGPADLSGLGPRRTQPAPMAAQVAGTRGTVTMLTLGSGGGVPGEPAYAWIVGDSRVAIVDPGDPSDEAADAILGAVARRGATVTTVLLTAPDPDRAAGAEGLGLRLGVPVRATAGAAQVLACAIDPLAAGETLDAADLPIRVRAAPDGRVDAVAYEVGATGIVIPGGPQADRR